MKPDASHIKQIKVVSNTHWDREFRWSFERTRHRLLTMLDVTLDILDKDPAFHSFTMDGHSIMIDDYLEIRPERRELVERLVSTGRLVIGPWYTLAEEFGLGHESIVRNLMWGRNTVEKYGGKTGTVAYTPASWGQTGQLPQIFADFGLNKMMFYRGISHHESDAEWIWEAPDGTRMLASRFGLYARYNWYYQVHRPVTTGRVFSKDYVWGEFDEAPFRFADGLAGEDLSFMLQDPTVKYDKTRLKQAIEDMIAAEGPHFTTEVFLAMNGHDISVAYPLESQVIADAKALFGDKYAIEHTNLEEFWKAAEAHLDMNALPVLTGERRSYLKEGKWTYLMPNTLSARTYLKQKDFAATVRLVYYAEPLASLATALGADYPATYLTRGWKYLLSNHTHDANAGVAPDPVCQDMEYRLRKTSDIADIVTEDAMAYIAKNLSPVDQPQDAMQVIVYNPLPFTRDAIVAIDLEVPQASGAKSVTLESANDTLVPRQPISSEKSGSFVDSIWDVPTILDSERMKFYAEFHDLPGLGYRTYQVKPAATELRAHGTLVTGPNTMENEHLSVQVNANGTVNMTCKATGKRYENLNYLSDQGEVGNGWRHFAPRFDRVYNSLGAQANVCVVESGPISSGIRVDYTFAVPIDYADGQSRNEQLVELPVQVEYRLEKGARALKVNMTLDNRAKDHWLRANFPTGLATDLTWADSHFDVVTREIPLPDSTGWVEPAGGVHPLRTFVEMNDGTNGLAIMPKGIFEYEAFEDAQRTLALTLIRACRIKLAVSEEKMTELPDLGVQCPGMQRFEYAISLHEGDWQQAGLLSEAAKLYTPVRAAMTGRGKGDLPLEASLITLDTAKLHITCVKQAEDGSGLIVRLFNGTTDEQSATLTFGKPLASATRCKLNEKEIEAATVNGASLQISIAPKKIQTYKVVLA